MHALTIFVRQQHAICRSTKKVKPKYERSGKTRNIMWLDVKVTYSNSASLWVGLVQVVPKKRGMTVVKNEKMR